MQYWQRRLHRAVTEMRRVRNGRSNRSRITVRIVVQITAGCWPRPSYRRRPAGLVQAWTNAPACTGLSATAHEAGGPPHHSYADRDRRVAPGLPFMQVEVTHERETVSECQRGCAGDGRVRL